jgi:hypothetical protein
MTIKLKLSAIIEAMECETDELPAYFNRKTGTIEIAHTEVLSAIDDGDDPQDVIEMHGVSENDIELGKQIIAGSPWLPLPSKFDIHDYKIMQDFAYSRDNPDLNRTLTNAVRGNGAFSRFRSAVQQAGVLDDWYAFKKSSYRDHAQDRCEVEGLEFIDDVTKTA